MESQDDIAYMIEQIVKQRFKWEEYGFFTKFAIDAISEHFIQCTSKTFENVNNIGIAYWRYIVLHLSDDTEIVYDLNSITSGVDENEDWESLLWNFEIGKNFYREIGLQELYSENNDRFLHAWSSLDDHISAMDAIFTENSKEWFFSGNWYLDDDDTFDANSSMRLDIVNPELLRDFDGETLENIQTQARGAYRDLIRMTYEYPIDMLSPSLREGIYNSIDVYTQMIMWVWDSYEWWARLFNKSSSEVELGISISIDRFWTTQEVMSHWLHIRSKIDANNFQDTTVEQRAYPFYMNTLNRASYQKMLDLGASKQELLDFAKAISGRDQTLWESLWSYGPDNYDFNFANTILWNLIGIPTQWENESQNQQESSLIERLIEKKDMQDVQDEKVLFSEDLTILVDESVLLCEKIWIPNPKLYINQSFFWWENMDNVLTWTYASLSLKNKISVSSLSRFISYIEEWINENPQSQTEVMQNNAVSIARMYTNPGGMSLSTDSIQYEQGNNFYVVWARATHWGFVYIQVPIEEIQSPGAASYYMTQLWEVLRSNYIVNQWGVYKKLNRENPNESETLSHEDISQMIEGYSYAQNDIEYLSGLDPNNLPEWYIENVRDLSISESFDYITDEIITQFDDGNWLDGESNFLDPQNLDTENFSNLEIDILETWTDLNGLWEWSDMSDWSVEMMKQWLKIGLIIGLSVIASTLTVWAASGGTAAATASWINFIRHSMTASKTLNATLRWRIIYGATMWFYAPPASWVIYPHGYSSREEMMVDLLSDMAVSTSTWALWWSLRPGTLTTISDFTVLWLMTEVARMKVIEANYDSWENFLDDNEIE